MFSSVHVIEHLVRIERPAQHVLETVDLENRNVLSVFFEGAGVVDNVDHRHGELVKFWHTGQQFLSAITEMAAGCGVKQNGIRHVAERAGIGATTLAWIIHELA